MLPPISVHWQELSVWKAHDAGAPGLVPAQYDVTEKAVGPNSQKPVPGEINQEATYCTSIGWLVLQLTPHPASAHSALKNGSQVGLPTG